MKNIFYYPITIILFLFSYNTVCAADLNINGQNNQIYENETYDKLIITNSSNITIRNCNFSSNSGNVVNINSSNHINVENSTIDGLVDACSGVQIRDNSSYIYFTGNTIHNIADDGVSLSGGSNHLYFTGNTIRNLYGVGTDSGGTCFNGHSDGFELFSVTDSEFVGNFVYDVRSNASFFMDDLGGGPSRNITLKNNIFYNPESGFVVYARNVDGMKIYNNTFWQGKYGGIVIEDNADNLEIYNNITHSINYSHFSGTQQANHYIDNNVLGVNNSWQGYTMNSNDVVDSNPFTGMHSIGGPTERNVAASDFTLKNTSSAIDHGIISTDVPTTDYFGNYRLGTPDIGAIEYGSGNFQISSLLLLLN